MLERRLNLLQAVSLNMSMMVGIGPFITIPRSSRTMGGPQAMLGWVLGALVALADGLVWSELAAAFPGSGGTYHFFDAVYGESAVGRLLKFLFVWQFLFSGPLEVASGRIGLSRLCRLPLARLSRGRPGAGDSVRPGPFDWASAWTELAGDGRDGWRSRRWPTGGSRRPGRLMVVLWAGDAGDGRLGDRRGAGPVRPATRLRLPAGRLDASTARSSGPGRGARRSRCTTSSATTRSATWATRWPTPSRTIPRSILISVAAVAAIYLTMNVGILGRAPLARGGRRRSTSPAT